ncbi:MAG: hypothetical protein C4330_12610 [Chitinophagaceae bacterium]
MFVSLILQYYDKDLKEQKCVKNNCRIEGCLPCVGNCSSLQGWLLCVGFVCPANVPKCALGC